MNPKTINSLLAIAALFCAPLAFAADTNIIPSLVIEGQTYLNAEIGTVKGSKVTIFYDGGGKQFAISNLPPDLQLRLNYNPAIASVNEAIEARQKAAIQQRLQEQAKAVAVAKAKLGPAQTIRVLKVINPSRLQIAANGILAEAYIHNLPFDVYNFVYDYNQTKAQADACRYADATATYTRHIGQGSSAYNVLTTNLTDDAVTVMLTRRHLAELEPQAVARTTIIACPTAYFINPGVRQWEFQAMPAAAGLIP
jgi:hypothetical protein